MNLSSFRLKSRCFIPTDHLSIFLRLDVKNETTYEQVREQLGIRKVHDDADKNVNRRKGLLCRLCSEQLRRVDDVGEIPDE